LGLKGSILFLEIVYLFFIFGGAAKLRWEGAQRPFWRVNEPKKTGARSARARTRGQNPLVIQIMRIRKDDIIAKYLHSAHTIGGNQRILKTQRQLNRIFGIGIIASGFTILF
jgi:hypothetical protein